MAMVLAWYRELREALTWKATALCSAVAVASWCTYKFVIYPLCLDPLRKIPGPPYRPIVGNMVGALQKEAMSNTIGWMQEYKSRIVKFYFFSETQVLVADPAMVKHIHVTNSKNYVRRQQTRSFFALVSNFLAFISGQRHHALRKLLQPAFTPNVISSFVPVYEEMGRRVADQWEEKLRQESNSTGSVTVEAQLAMSCIGLDVISKCGFDFDMGAIEDPQRPLVTSLKRLLSGASIRITQAVPLFSKISSKERKQAQSDIATFKDLVSTVLRECHAESGAADSTDGTVKGAGDSKRSLGSLMSLLLQARDQDGQTMDLDLLFQQIGGFMFAGFETTSQGLTWTLLLLAQHPEIQDRVRQEVMSVLTRDQPITMAELDQLTYLTCVINESLRLYPPVTVIFRRALKDDVLGGYRIPAGTVVGTSVGALHRLPENWKDPEEFRPERFQENYDSYCFMPFATGAYRCIGDRFSMAEMKTVLSLLLPRFKFSVPSDYTYRRIQRITMQPDPPLRLNIVPVQ